MHHLLIAPCLASLMLQALVLNGSLAHAALCSHLRPGSAPHWCYKHVPGSCCPLERLPSYFFFPKKSPMYSSHHSLFRFPWRRSFAGIEWNRLAPCIIYEFKTSLSTLWEDPLTVLMPSSPLKSYIHILTSFWLLSFLCRRILCSYLECLFLGLRWLFHLHFWTALPSLSFKLWVCSILGIVIIDLYWFAAVFFLSVYACFCLFRVSIFVLLFWALNESLFLKMLLSCYFLPPKG